MKALLLIMVLALCVVGQRVYTQQTTNPEELIIINDEGAEESASEDQPEDESRIAMVSTWDFVRMILILAAVVGVIYLFFFLLKRSTNGRRAERDLINVHDYRSLGGSRGLYLVEVGASIYLVGASDNGVNLVSEITEKESLDTIHLALAQVETSDGARKSFGGILGELFGSPHKGSRGQGGAQFIESQKERLRRLR